MKCKCGYEGEPEYGDFGPWESHIRCPKCKTMGCFIVESYERVKMAILYPEHCAGREHAGNYSITHERAQMTVTVSDRGDYLIYCPVCGWGEGGRLSEDKAKELRKLLLVNQKEGKWSIMHSPEDEAKLVGKRIKEVCTEEDMGLTGLIFEDRSHIVIVKNVKGKIDWLYDEPLGGEK